MSKIAKILSASAVIFSSAVLPATAATQGITPANTGIDRISGLSQGELIATGANNESYYVCIKSGHLNVRNASGRSIGRVYRGQTLSVTAFDGSRYQIRYGRGYGWVSSQFVCYGA